MSPAPSQHRPSPHGRHRCAHVVRAAVLAVAAVPVVVAAGWSSAGYAHPFGAPQTLALAESGTEIVLEWTAATDDLTALAGALGLVASAQTFVYDADGNLESGPEPEADQLAGVADAPALVDYLQSHVMVRADAGTCPVVADTSGFPARTVLVASCPDPATTVDLEVTLLQDLHPAYRTVATSPSGESIVLTSAQPTGQLAMVGQGGGGTRMPWPIALVAVGALVVGSVLVVRRRRSVMA